MKLTNALASEQCGRRYGAGLAGMEAMARAITRGKNCQRKAHSWHVNGQVVSPKLQQRAIERARMAKWRIQAVKAVEGYVAPYASLMNKDGADFPCKACMATCLCPACLSSIAVCRAGSHQTKCRTAWSQSSKSVNGHKPAQAHMRSTTAAAYESHAHHHSKCRQKT